MGKQAGAELCQAQVQLEVVVEIGAEFGVEVEACHYQPGWVVVGGGWTKTKLMLFSTQVEVVVELKLELSLATFCYKSYLVWYAI